MAFPANELTEKGTLFALGPFWTDWPSPPVSAGCGQAGQLPRENFSRNNLLSPRCDRSTPEIRAGEDLPGKSVRRTFRKMTARNTENLAQPGLKRPTFGLPSRRESLYFYRSGARSVPRQLGPRTGVAPSSSQVRTRAFQARNTGSNPVGVTSHLRISSADW